MNRLLLIPSFYGSLAWWGWLIVYLAAPLGWDEPRAESVVCFVAAGVAFSTGAVYSYLSPEFRAFPTLFPARSLILGLLAAGLGGIVFHLYTLAQSLHGIPNVISTLATRSFEIRWENAEVTSIGVQISYLGWLACGVLALVASDPKYERSSRIMASGAWVAVFISNLAMVDRTRPFWILVTSILVVFSTKRLVRIKKALVTAIAATVTLVTIFVAVAVWSGKVGEHSPGGSTAEAGIINLALYGTGGFAYFDRITTYYPMPSMIPEQLLYPMFKIFASTGLADEPPSQILDFESIPHEVNVGTLLTPLYLDGGWLYVACLLPALIFGVDRLARAFLQSTCPVQRYAWAALCYAQLLAFFSSPLPGTPCWFFVFAGLCSMAKERLQSHKGLSLLRDDDACVPAPQLERTSHG